MKIKIIIKAIIDLMTSIEFQEKENVNVLSKSRSHNEDYF